MSRGKKWNLVVFGSLGLACVLAPFSCVRRTDPPAEEARPTILKGHQFPVQALAFGPEGTTLTSAAYYLEAQGLEVAVWDIQTRQATTLLKESPGSVLAVRLHAGGGTLAATVQGRAPALWDVKPWHERRRLEGHESSGYAA